MRTTTETKPAGPVADETDPTFWNGHNRAKYFGNTKYDGELKSLPYSARPVGIVAAVQAMYTDVYVIFPGVLDADEVKATPRQRRLLGDRA